MIAEPYLSFEGRAEEAIAFYVATLGAEVDMMLRFRDAPPPDAGGCQPPEGTPLPPPEKIMHARLTFGTAGVMVSDGMCMGDSKAVFTGFALSLSVADPSEAERVYAAIATNGGTAQMPLQATFFSPAFGIAADKFGVPWMVVAQQAN